MRNYLIALCMGAGIACNAADVGGYFPHRDPFYSAQLRMYGVIDLLAAQERAEGIVMLTTCREGFMKAICSVAPREDTDTAAYVYQLRRIALEQPRLAEECLKAILRAGSLVVLREVVSTPRRMLWKPWKKRVTSHESFIIVGFLPAQMKSYSQVLRAVQDIGVAYNALAARCMDFLIWQYDVALTVAYFAQRVGIQEGRAWNSDEYEKLLKPVACVAKSLCADGVAAIGVSWPRLAHRSLEKLLEWHRSAVGECERWSQRIQKLYNVLDPRNDVEEERGT